MGKNISKTVAIESEVHLELFDAVEKGQLYQIKNLLETEDQSELLSARKKGKTLLHCAVLHGQPGCVKFLLDSGVNPNVIDDYGDSPLLEVAHCSSLTKIKSQETIVDLLVSAKADINARSALGRTALLKCIVEYRFNIAEKLLNMGADPNIGDIDGLHPIHVSATYKLFPLLRKLLDHGGNINAQDGKGRTALYVSINAGHQEIARELVLKGCDINLGSSFGYPLSAAITKCQSDTVNLLLHSGVDVKTRLNEQRQVLIKGEDYLNLSLIVFHIHSAIADMSHYKEKPRIETLKSVISIVDQITMAMGKQANFNKNIFFRSKKPDFSGDPGLQNLEKKLMCVYRRLVFVHEMNKNFGYPVLEGMPKLDESLKKVSLQNICRLKLREVLLDCGNNILHSTDKLECPAVLKDIITLKDIGWG